MFPWLFLLFFGGVAAGTVGTIIFFATRRTPPSTTTRTEELPPTVTLTVTPANFCIGTPVRVRWTSDGASTRVTASRSVAGFPSSERSGDTMVTIDDPAGMSQFITEFTAVSSNGAGASPPRSASTTGHRGEFIIASSREARCAVDQIFPDRGFRNPNARRCLFTFSPDTFGDMRATEVEIFPYPTPTYGYPVPQPHRFSVYHDNVMVVPQGDQIATYTGLVRGEWKIITERLHLNNLEEPDEPCDQSEPMYAQLIVGIKIKVACS